VIVGAMQFAKYHGLGNDFVIVDLRSHKTLDRTDVWSPDRVREICDRRFGIGGDGVLALLAPTTPGAVATMRVLNSDGGEAEMCGNGLRCVAKYLYERTPDAGRPGDRMTIDTGAGPLACALAVDRGEVTSVTVNMGAPRLARRDIPMTGPADERCVSAAIDIAGRSLELTCVGTGNPHAIAFVDDTGPALRRLAETVGPPIENHTWFPQRTNVELARAVSPTEIEVVVWERGCGITLACGTGACATAVAACVTGRAQPDTDIQVRLLGGPLSIRVAADYSAIWMTGPAEHVFDGSLARS
jgi:diaminopimelate epimerase